MEKITLSPRRARLAALTIAVGLLLTGCSGETAPATPVDNVAPPAQTVIPTAWIEATTKAWPDSDGKKAGAMFLSGPSQCALGQQPVRALGVEFRWDMSGYGPLDSVPDTGDSFVHHCRLSDSHHRPGDDSPLPGSGEVVLTRYADTAGLLEGLARFRSQTDTPVQDNEVTHLTSGRYPVDALRRWYPTNPQGLYQAMVVDEQQRATLLLEVNVVPRAAFEAASAQKVADALTDFLDRSRSAPAAAPPTVPDWADSLWEDTTYRFQIPIAKGWSHDPATGQKGDPTTLARFLDKDGSASLTVIPTPMKDPLPLSTVVEKIRVLSKARPGTAILSEEPMTLDDGTAAHRLDLKLPSGKRSASVLVIIDNYLFQIIGSAPADRWGSTQEDMMRMARSFTTP